MADFSDNILRTQDPVELLRRRAREQQEQAEAQRREVLRAARDQQAAQEAQLQQLLTAARNPDLTDRMKAVQAGINRAAMDADVDPYAVVDQQLQGVSPGKMLLRDLLIGMGQTLLGQEVRSTRDQLFQRAMLQREVGQKRLDSLREEQLGLLREQGDRQATAAGLFASLAGIEQRAASTEATVAGAAQRTAMTQDRLDARNAQTLAARAEQADLNRASQERIAQARTDAAAQRAAAAQANRPSPVQESVPPDPRKVHTFTGLGTIMGRQKTRTNRLTGAVEDAGFLGNLAFVPEPGVVKQYDAARQSVEAAGQALNAAEKILANPANDPEAFQRSFSVIGIASDIRSNVVGGLLADAAAGLLEGWSAENGAKRAGQLDEYLTQLQRDDSYFSLSDNAKELVSGTVRLLAAAVVAFTGAQATDNERKFLQASMPRLGDNSEAFMAAMRRIETLNMAFQAKIDYVSDVVRRRGTELTDDQWARLQKLDVTDFVTGVGNTRVTRDDVQEFLAEEFNGILGF